MAKDWDSFVQEWSDRARQGEVFRLTRLVAPMFKSPIERIMYVILKDSFEWSLNQGKAVLEPQKKIEKYRADFYFAYMSDKQELVEFIIECDGHDYHERTKEQAAHDKRRDRFFTERGYIVLRYTGSEIFKNYDKLTDPIYTIIFKKDGV